MAHVVGTKGQGVIAKEIRYQLGVQPGWLAIQRLVGDHVEVCFLPPEHRKSLEGSLGKYINVHIAPDQDWDEARLSSCDRPAKETGCSAEQTP